MRAMRQGWSVIAVILACVAIMPARADNVPSIHQVYQAANTGHLDDAQLMMERVLRAHPESAKAHYVEAELLARMDRPTQAGSELQKARQLEPGLPFVKSQSVRELEQQIARENAVVSGGISSVTPHKSFPWGALLLGLGLLALLILLVRLFFRRNQTSSYYPAADNGAYATYPPAGPVVQPSSGGLGAGIVGGLATGAAVGAGMVAGEMLAHKLLDGNSPAAPDVSGWGQGNTPAPDDTDYSMGGNDFGLTDASSWDDGGSSDSVGGDDWS